MLTAEDRAKVKAIEAAVPPGERAEFELEVALHGSVFDEAFETGDADEARRLIDLAAAKSAAPWTRLPADAPPALRRLGRFVEHRARRNVVRVNAPRRTSGPSGRPRAATTRSSAASGDSGEDGPSDDGPEPDGLDGADGQLGLFVAPNTCPRCGAALVRFRGELWCLTYGCGALP